MIPDNQLIEQVKKEQNSDALNELINRHTGIYMSVINSYSGAKHIAIPELKEEKLYNIYNWALSYDPSKKMKFGTYVGQMTKFMCKSLITRGREFEPIETIFEKTDENSSVISNVITDEIEESITDIDDDFVNKVIDYRINKNMTFREIGKKMNKSHEWIRIVYNKNIKTLQENFNE